MTAEELRSALQRVPAPVLLHVLPPECFERAHLPGSLNACVYETAFLSQVQTLVPDPATPLVVYGDGCPHRAAETASEKLRDAGYSSVSAFAGGLREWRAAGGSLEGNATAPEPPSLERLTGSFTVDPARSVIFWKGRNLFNHHHGSAKLTDGSFRAEAGTFSSAEFSVDLKSIACADLTDAAYNAMLLAHLATDDFFDTARFPVATFRAAKVEPLPDATPGTVNYRLEGDFTLRGVTRPLAFDAVCALNEAGELVAQAELDLDRTAWGSLYGSGKFYEFLGKHVVNDLVHLHILLVARPAGAE